MPIALSSYPRGHTVPRETWCPMGHILGRSGSNPEQISVLAENALLANKNRRDVK